MELFILKRDHHEGQDVYGIYESVEKANEGYYTLKEWYPNVPKSDFYIKKVRINKLDLIEAYDEEDKIDLD